MGRTSDLTPEQNERVRDALRRLIVKYGSQNELAAVLGVAPASLSRLLTGKFGASSKLAGAIAFLSGIELVELLGGNKEHLEGAVRDAERAREVLELSLAALRRNVPSGAAVEWAVLAIAGQIVALDARLETLAAEIGLANQAALAGSTNVQGVEPGEGVLYESSPEMPRSTSALLEGPLLILEAAYKLADRSLSLGWVRELKRGLLVHVDYACGIYSRWKSKFILDPVRHDPAEHEKRLAQIKRIEELRDALLARAKEMDRESQAAAEGTSHTDRKRKR
jgi:transcriptional regulator with XRE-family HTH domain